jgi:hypothetical protein
VRSLQSLRNALGTATGVATMVGIGPRFQHSTGQLHKGGPKSGVFLQIVQQPEADLPIPGRPFGFRQLVNAQADGDYLALRDQGLRVFRVTADGDFATTIQRMIEAAARSAVVAD